MKVFDIALKDLLRSLRSAMFLAFGLGLPLLMAGIFYFAFGGLGSDDAISVPQVRVQFASLDETGEEHGYFSAGEMLFDLLGAEELAELLQVTPALDVASARAAVDNQEADVAVIVPAGFTDAVFDPEGRAAIELYQDPTLTLGPAIVKDIVSSFVDTFAGSKIAANLTYDLAAERGDVAAAETLQDVSSRYARWAVGLMEEEGANPLLALRSPSGGEGQSGGDIVSMVSLIMAGMMVFYTFFTGAASAQSILQEEEEGTLSRLFTTPTPRSAILGGKFLSIFAILVVQVIALLVVSAFVFEIDWGEPLPVTLVSLGLIVVAASFGIFVTSLLKDTQQVGIIYGGVMTVAGMLGMSSVFTGGASGPMDTVSLVVPQGWGVRAWRLLLEGGGLRDVLPTVAVMLAMSVGFFLFGVFKFRKRFA